MGTVLDLFLVILGFSLIVFVHEAGHFLAAKWAGIRVLAFALGFGPALLSYRKGFGVRRGSSEGEYQRMLREAGNDPRRVAGISPTEYRWNVLPLGGYVKMLGQDDSDPSARSDEPDSFQRCVVWKRMVVISAGVVMNIIMAAVLFVIVFSAGLLTEPPRIGDVVPGSPAATTMADNAAAFDITEPGLKPGDTVQIIDGAGAASFKDIAISSVMAGPSDRLIFEVRRRGVDGLLRFSIKPQMDPVSRLMSIGAYPMASPVLDTPRKDQDRARAAMDRAGLKGIPFGARLASVGGKPAADGVYSLIAAARTSDGNAVAATFEFDGQRRQVAIRPRPEMQTTGGVEHLLGLAGVLMVEQAGTDGAKAGLRDGDVFALLGNIEWPGVEQGIAEIKRDGRTSIKVIVWRAGPDGNGEFKDLGEVPVHKGVIGFTPGTTALTSNVLSRLPREVVVETPADGPVPSAARLNLAPGSRILSVDGTAVANLGDVRAALQRAASASKVAVMLSVREPFGQDIISTYRLSLSEADRKAVLALGWTSPVGPWFFAPEKVLLRATTASGGLDVWGALTMGLHETKNVMLQTYLTFARLLQRTVQVEHLKGPVGIAQVGTQIADRGFVWLLFFMAVVSVNLAVINFLPMPIVDGGHFVFLLWEQFTGRPVSVAVQNAATVVGLLMIGSVFLFVTYNDLVNLFKG